MWPHYSWLQDYQTRAEVDTTDTGLELQIAAARASDAGRYKCSLKVGDHTQTLVQTVHIRGGSEEEEDSSKVLQLVEGDEMNLSCLASTQAGNSPQVSWNKEVSSSCLSSWSWYLSVITLALLPSLIYLATKHSWSSHLARTCSLATVANKLCRDCWFSKSILVCKHLSWHSCPLLIVLSQDGNLPGGQEREDGPVLRVERVGLEDSGTYVCTAFDSQAQVVHRTVQVTVLPLSPPKPSSAFHSAHSLLLLLFTVQALLYLRWISRKWIEAFCLLIRCNAFRAFQ